MGHTLSQQVLSDAQFILQEVVGMGMEQSFLDPATSAMRQQEIQQRFDGLMNLTSHPKMRNLMFWGSAADISLYLDRQKLYGEEAALRWWIERN